MEKSRMQAAFHALFGELTEETMREYGVFQRMRKFTPVSLVATFVLGLLAKPDADDRDLTATAARLGVSVTPQAISNRLTVSFQKALQQLFQRLVTHAVDGGGQTLAPILSRFTKVVIRDSSTISLPASQRDPYPDCGGSKASDGAAAMKLQTEFDLRSGAIVHLQIEPGKLPDAATSRQFAACESGELRITDLGYFNLAAFEKIHQQQAYFLSRVQIDTKLRLDSDEETPIDLAWLKRQPPGLISVKIMMGVHQRLRCRLIAFRVPEEQANRRKQKRREMSLRKRHREPHPEALEWCEWTLLVTNVPEELLTAPETIILYRARWQIELLFKRWKSIGRIDLLDGRNDTETMIRLWSRLIGVMLQHWFTMTATWHHGASHSMYQIANKVREIAHDLIHILMVPSAFHDVIELFCRLTQSCRHNPRKKPSTFEMLNNPAKLDFRLT